MKTTFRLTAAVICSCAMLGGCATMVSTTAFPPQVDDPARLSPGLQSRNEPSLPSGTTTARPQTGAETTPDAEPDILDLDQGRVDEDADARRLETPAVEETAAAIELTVSAPEQTQVGSGATFQITLETTGDRPLDDVVVEADFDKAFVFPGHPEKRIKQQLGQLAAGQSRELAVMLVAEKPGKHCVRFTVTAGGEEAAWKEVCVEFVPRSLAVEVIGPAERTVGSRAEFTIMIANEGASTLKDVVAAVTYHQALEPREGSTGAKFEQGRLTWDVGDLPAGEGVPLQIEFECTAAAEEADVVVETTGSNVPAESHKQFLRIARQRGMFAVDIRDTPDPVKSGEPVTYEVTVRNRAPQAAHDVELTSLLPDGLTLVSSEVSQGDEKLDITGKADDRKVSFAAVETLPPDAVLSYRITTKTAKAGNLELTVRVKHALSDEPLTVSEPTTVNP